MTNSTDQEREVFEAAMQKHSGAWPFYPWSGCKREDGSYALSEEHAAWTAWQARAQQPASVAVPKGYALVPVRPTPAILDAIDLLCDDHRAFDDSDAFWSYLIAAAPHPVSGEQKPVTEFSQDISKGAQAWMQLLGDFGPTVRVDSMELKGYTRDKDGDTVKTYYDSGELRELSAACLEVADWLERRAQQAKE